MNQQPPPLLAPSRATEPSKPTWLIVLIVVGAVGFVGIVMVGLLAAIAIPNFVKARQTAQMNMCINNLRMVDNAKQQWALENKKQPADTPMPSEVVENLPNHQFPICPAGGHYLINAIGEDPTCSVPNHHHSGSYSSPSR